MKTLSLYSRNTSRMPDLPYYEVAVEVSISGSEEADEQLITSTCVTEREVDTNIDGLIALLNQLRKAAKAKIAGNR